MWALIKHYKRAIITVLVTFSVCIWLYACESQVKSLDGSKRLINRAELQLELDRFIGMAEIRMADLDKQDALRMLIIENSLLVVQGMPFNPFAFLTGLAGIYGVTHAATKTTRTITKRLNKKKVNNGTT